MTITTVRQCYGCKTSIAIESRSKSLWPGKVHTLAHWQHHCQHTSISTVVRVSRLGSNYSITSIHDDEMPVRFLPIWHCRFPFRHQLFFDERSCCNTYSVASFRYFWHGNSLPFSLHFIQPAADAMLLIISFRLIRCLTIFALVSIQKRQMGNMTRTAFNVDATLNSYAPQNRHEFCTKCLNHSVTSHCNNFLMSVLLSLSLQHLTREWIEQPAQVRFPAWTETE